MYIKSLAISNFRSIENLTVAFNPSTNVLIGENNAGKSTILDALRVCLSYGSQRRDIYISKSDFFIDRTVISDVQPEIGFDLVFHITDEKELGWFNDLLAVDEKGNYSLQVHFRYWIDLAGNIKYNVWGGDKKGQPISPDTLQHIYHVYLGALRDAVRSLRPVKSNRLGQLFSKIQVDTDVKKDREKKNEMALSVKNSVDANPEWNAHIAKGKSKINEHFSHSTFTNDNQEIDISFLPFDFQRLVDNLKVHMPVYSQELINGDSDKQKYFELYQNGLGYNNLIYAATVLGDLKERKLLQKEAYAALIIEEPEAHLHPQLQNLFFSYLGSLKDDCGFQTFVSSHSPTITAKSNLDDVIVIQSQSQKTVSLALKDSNLTPDNRIFLSKFLDVTKSQLLFAKGVILVEGIAEALLYPVFSKIMGDSFDLEKAGVEVVNINGVAFEHFANLFNSDNEEKRLASRCSLVSDDDGVFDESGKWSISNRAENAKKLSGDSLSVFLAKKTFEHELFSIESNQSIMLEIFKEMHPVAGKEIEQCDVSDEKPDVFLKKVESNKAKSELAHRLAIKLQENLDEGIDISFVIPEYIKGSIKYALNEMP